MGDQTGGDQISLMCQRVLIRGYLLEEFGDGSQQRDFPIARNPAEKRRGMSGDKSLYPWKCFYEGSGHLAPLELSGGQHKSLYFRQCERRSFSDPVADAIILG
jgi:hypothetical protein